MIAYSDDNDRACVIKIDKKLARTYSNTVVACVRCAGRASNVDNLLDLQHHILNPEPPKPQIKNPETIARIREFLDQEGYQDTHIPKGYEHAPPAVAEHIARGIIRIANRPKGHGKEHSKSRGYKRCWLESQNHRCCYCGIVMDNDPTSPAFATWEHIQSLRDGGTNYKDNVVIACTTCNSLRDHFDMQAMEYYEWAVENIDEIRRRQNQSKRWDNTRRGLRKQKQESSKLYSYE